MTASHVPLDNHLCNSATHYSSQDTPQQMIHFWTCMNRFSSSAFVSRSIMGFLCSTIGMKRFTSQVKRGHVLILWIFPLGGKCWMSIFAVCIFVLDVSGFANQFVNLQLFMQMYAKWAAVWALGKSVSPHRIIALKIQDKWCESCFPIIT